MRRSVFLSSALLLATMGLAAGSSTAHDDEPAPSKAPVEVTYYFLPG